MRGYTTRTIAIPTDWGKMKLTVLTPKAASLPVDMRPGVLWMHGGGFATGFRQMAHFTRAAALAGKYGAVVVSPGYRMAGRWPYPAAVEDCYAALLYMKAHARELGFEPSRLMVGGESAGGGLAAVLCMMARDRGEVSIAFQMPLYPMIDDRDTESSRRNYSLPWKTLNNHAAWKLYLRKVKGEKPVYAAPARQTDFSGLPPCYTFVGAREPFYCETLAYAENLRKAGVRAQAEVYPTSVHAFDMLMPWRRISKAAIAGFETAYLFASEHFTAEQPGAGGP